MSNNRTDEEIMLDLFKKHGIERTEDLIKIDKSLSDRRRERLLKLRKKMIIDALWRVK